MKNESLYCSPYPFIKWAGGKRWLAQSIENIVPKSFNFYLEPFLGGGAMFFAINPEKSLLSDVNFDLINSYIEIQKNPSEVFSLLKSYQALHCEQFYYEIRSSKPTNSIEAAARFLYLNRTCFNGIYRVNLSGIFNVPKGSKNNVVYEYDDFEAVSRRLAHSLIRTSDFEDTIGNANMEDFCFCDPPYTVTHNKNGFIKYNEKIFSWNDQIRLRDSVLRAHDRGALVLITNADHESIRELYDHPSFTITSISRRSVIGADSSSRGSYEEVLIRNYELV